MEVTVDELPKKLPTTPNPFVTDPTAGEVPLETVKIALNDFQRATHTLKLAGIEPKIIDEVTQALRKGVEVEEDRRTEAAERRAKEENPSLVFEEGPKSISNLPSSEPTPGSRMSGRKLFSGPILKLQRGDGGFSALWKERWVVIERGWIKCYQSSQRPEPATFVKNDHTDYEGKGELKFEHEDNTYVEEEKPSVALPLTDKTTVINENLSTAFIKKFNCTCPFEVTTCDMFGSKRSISFNCLSDKTRRQWINAIQKGTVTTKFSPTPSLFKAAQNADIETLKHLLQNKGKNVNAENRYGYTALGYSCKATGDAATQISFGKPPAVSLSDALRCVAFLMSSGANPTHCNEKGDDCFTIARNCTEHHPRCRRVLMSLLDSSTYTITGSTVWINSKEENKLMKKVERQLAGLMVEDIGGVVSEDHQKGKPLQNVKYDEEKPLGDKVRVLYSKNKVETGKEAYDKTVEENHSMHSKYTNVRSHPPVKSRAMNDEGFRENALWPENVGRDRQEYIPHKSRERDVYRGREQKDESNPLVKFFNEPDTHLTKPQVDISQINNDKKKSTNGGFSAGEVIQAVTRRDRRMTNRTEHLTTTAKEMRRSSKRPKSASSSGLRSEEYWRPGKWTTDLPKYGSYDRIMQKRPNSAGGNSNSRGPRQHFSDGSFPQKFVSKTKPIRRERERERPKSASSAQRRSRNCSNNIATISRKQIQTGGRYLAISSSSSPIHKKQRPRSATTHNRSKRHHRHITAIDSMTGAQVGINRAPPPRANAHRLGDHWFGEERVPLNQCKQDKSFPAQYNDSKGRGGNTFGTQKQSGSKQFRPGFNGKYAAGTFIHDQPGGTVGSGARAAMSLKQNKAHKFMIKNADALKIISNWHALGGTNLEPKCGGDMVYTEQGNAISYDSLKDLTAAFRMIQKSSDARKRGQDLGDMITVHDLIKTLGSEAEKLDNSELARLIREADPEDTGMVNFKHYCAVIVNHRIKFLPKGSLYNAEDDHVSKMKRDRLRRERGQRRRQKEVIGMMGGRDIDKEDAGGGEGGSVVSDLTK